MFDINGWEFILLAVLAVIVLGPERLPDYAAKLGRFVRQAKGMAERARSQLKEEMGPEFADLDWRQYDPRQYDPRKIVRDALASPDPSPPHGAAATPAKPVSTPKGHDPALPTPWDTEAT